MLPQLYSLSYSFPLFLLQLAECCCTVHVLCLFLSISILSHHPLVFHPICPCTFSSFPLLRLAFYLLASWFDFLLCKPNLNHLDFTKNLFSFLQRFDTNEEMVAHQAKHLTESKYKVRLRIIFADSSWQQQLILKLFSLSLSLHLFIFLFFFVLLFYCMCMYCLVAVTHNFIVRALRKTFSESKQCMETYQGSLGWETVCLVSIISYHICILGGLGKIILKEKKT